MANWLKLLPFVFVCWLAKKKAGRYSLCKGVVAYDVFKDYWIIDVKESKKQVGEEVF